MQGETRNCHCKKSEQKFRDEKLYKSPLDKDTKSFWTKIKNRRGGTCKPSDEIDGVKGISEIASLFADNFSLVIGKLSNVNNNSSNVDNIYLHCQ